MTSLTRVINPLIHEMTAPQMLERLLRLFGESRNSPVYLAAMRGDGDRLVRLIRVELSRARKRSKEEGVKYSQFGFTDSKMEVMTKLRGLDVEYYQLEFRVTARQRFLTIMDQTDIGELAI